MPKLLDFNAVSLEKWGRTHIAFHARTYLLLFPTGGEVFWSYSLCSPLVTRFSTVKSLSNESQHHTSTLHSSQCYGKTLTEKMHYILWLCSISIPSLLFLTCLWALFRRWLWSPADGHLSPHSAECLVDHLPLLSAQGTKWSIGGLAACKMPC